ncbi:MAG: cyanophycin synthetase [Motiliproteus sp.]|jgi:cyanophycin synthetase
MAHKYVTALQASSVPGFRYGLRQPEQLLHLSFTISEKDSPWSKIDTWLTAKLDVKIVEFCPPDGWAEVPYPRAFNAAAWCWRVLLTAQALLGLGGVPIFEPGRVLRLSADAKDPQLWHAEAAVAQVNYVAEHWFRRAYEAASIIVTGLVAHLEDFSDPEPLYRQLETQLIGPLWAANSSSHSNLALLRAADAAQIPWQHQGGGVYQFGWGKRLLRVQNSQLASDSWLGKQVAGHKYASAQRLKRAGLPTPRHRLVNSTDTALQAAQRLGWPVVIKPADSVGGQGVTLNIRTESGVRDAFKQALQISRQVLVEKQVPGCVHHIQVASAKVPYVLRRQPVAVQGDGMHTLAELVAIENSERQRLMLWRRKPPLPLDALALSCLQGAGFTVEEIPPAGLWVPLREVPTNADGGRDEDITKLIHPDNEALALRAAKILGLGLAAVDMISTDISIPWHLNGAIINEVNNAPLLGLGASSIAAIPDILMQLIDDDGRIPIEVFIGGEKALAQGRQRQHALSRQGLACFLCNHRMTEDPNGASWSIIGQGVHPRIRALLMDKQVDAIVLILHTDECLEQGLPVDHISRLEVVDHSLVSHNGVPIKPDRVALLLRLLHQAVTSEHVRASAAAKQESECLNLSTGR